MVLGKSCCLLGAVLLIVLQPSNAIIEVGGNGGGGVENTPCDWPTGQQYWPHPTNCRMYVQCTPYGPQEMPCAPGTAWSQSLLTCDHIANTPCGEHPPPPPENGGGGGGDETPEPCILLCPLATGLFPHPRECNKWVECNDWDICVKRCPLGLAYNPIDKKCDWKSQSNCIATPDAPCIIPIPEPPTPAPIIVIPEVCDCECCLRPHPTDCTSYYYCAPGDEAEFHTCSEGLVFNPDLGQCVPAMTYPECVPEVPPTCDPTCECVYPSEACQIYYKCDEGTPIKHECLGGLVYNDKIHSCDNPANVDCDAQAPSKRGFIMKGLKNAIRPEDCATRNGNFPAGLSNEYYFCTKGMAFLMQCPGKAVFDAETGKCQV